MIARDTLIHLYESRGLSSAEIAKKLNCSQQQVNYWLKKWGVKKRSISDALYKKWNPKGDPFSYRMPRTVEEGVLFGLGVGLYWGEGTKANKNSVRLGNTDPNLIRKFVDFLVYFYQIDKARLRFGLQIFSDMNADAARAVWIRQLRISRKQFHPSTIVTPHRGIGNYRQKTKYGVLTIYFNNKKLRDILCHTIEDIAMDKPL